MLRLTYAGIFVIAAILFQGSSDAQVESGKRVAGLDPISDLGEATKHFDALKVMVIQLHWAWKEAQEQADDAHQASQAALEAASKCGDVKSRDSAQALISIADAKLAAASDAGQRAATWEKETLQDGENTLQALATKDPAATKHATFAKLQDTQKSFYLAVITIKAGLDPGDDLPTGSGELTQAKDLLKQARAALAKCGGHAAATGATRERLASRSER